MTAINRRTQQFWTVAAGVLLCAIVLLAHLYLPSQASQLAAKIIQSIHGPGFGLVALVFLMLVRSDGAPIAAYLKAAAFAMILAGLGEAAQIPGPRTPQINDLLIDALGILGFLGIAAILNRDVRSTIGKRRTALLTLSSIPALVLTLTPTLWLSFALAMRTQALPQILSFDEPWERTYSSGVDARPDIIPAPAGWPEESGKIARIHSAGQWGLMLHIHPHPDWSHYSAVSFVAATTNNEVRHISVGLWGISPGDGTPQGRYYTRVKVGPVPARHCIFFADLDQPSSQTKFDLTHVYELLVGATKNETGVELLVDDFRLERLAGSCPSRQPPARKSGSTS